MTWASTSVDDFGGNRTFTHGSTYNPETGSFVSSDNLVHNSFCAGVAMLPDGSPFAAGGGATVKTTTVFNRASNTWSRTDDMQTERWYATSTTLPSGQVHTALGTMDHPFTEIWTENDGWNLQNNISLQSILDDTSIPRANQRDWYPALNVAPDGSLFHPGPMPEVFSLNLSEINAFESHGQRENGNPHRLYNTTVMYDVGKMLLAGGGQPALSSAMTIDLNGSSPFIAPTNSMRFARAMQNSVVLPHGEVLVIGGNSSGMQFSDEGTQLIPEVWNPDTGQWTNMAPLSEPRNYHSTALLLKDGRVAAMGGGLCGNCGVNYQTGQIFEPPYLFNADGSEAVRPTIAGNDIVANAGQTITVKGSSNITAFSMVRLVALTHHHTTDQRRVPLNFQSAGDGSYQLEIPSNTNVVIPGYYWIFAMDSNGVPSVGRTVRINVTDNNEITSPEVPDTVSYEYFEGVWDNLPNFDQLTPVETGEVAGFLLTPAQQDDNFAFRFRARINVTQAGQYTFYTSSDDGSALFVNGEQIVDNDGTHGVNEEQGNIQLSAGEHDLVVTYFERTGGAALNVSWEGPGFSQTNISSGLIELGSQAAPVDSGEQESIPLSNVDNQEEPVVVPTGGQAGGQGGDEASGIVSYEYFEGEWENLPNFNQLTPVETGYLDSFSLAPAQQGDNFAFRYNSTISVDQTGEYTFFTVSDDGSALFINGQQVVNNDGIHRFIEQQGAIQLAAGEHDIQVTYFERAGGNELEVSWQGPGFSRQSIDSGLIGSSSNVDLPVTQPVTQPVGIIWADLDESENYIARHESSFVQAGDRFYLFGGRESPQTVDTYNFAQDTWTTSASAPAPFNHFQATEYQGLIWVIGAFKNNSFPNEEPADYVYTYDPANDLWLQGHIIPVERRRGSAGLVEFQGKFYVVGGNTIGHNGGYVSWFDEYDPQTGSWTPLADAPSARDHFHATVANGKLYVAGGRLSGGPGGTFAPLIATVDVYDFATGAWSTLPSSGDLPTPRAGASTVTFQDNVVVIGGEGDGQAYATVEQLDPSTNLWSEISSLNHARHGTQAIVSGNGIFTAAGSPNQGGGRQRNMEAFNSSTPAGTANTPATLEFTVNEIVINSDLPQEVDVLHISGSQGAMITSIDLIGNDGSSFAISDPAELPNLVLAGGFQTISVRANTATDGEQVKLLVTYDDGATIDVLVRAELDNPLDNSDTPINQSGSLENLALGAFAEQSSTDFDGIASRAVDGNTDGSFNRGSVTHTVINTQQPWWQADLGGLNSIDNIVLHNRTNNCCTDRLSNFYVLTSSTPFGNRSLSDLLSDDSVKSRFRTGLNDDSITLDFNNVQARYVRVQLLNTGTLSLAEVEVFGSEFNDTVEPVVDPVEPVVDPVEPVVDPVEPEVDPNEPEADSVEPEAEADVEGTDAGDADAEVVADTGGGDTSGSLLQEAEVGTVFGNMVVVNDVQASGGQFVHVPSNVVGNNSSDFVEITAVIDTAGSYQLTAIVRGPSGSQNSFFVQINDGEVYLWDIPSNNQFTADVVSNRGSGDVTETLSAGVHTVRVFVREEGAQLDLIKFELLEAIETETGDIDTEETGSVATETGESDTVGVGTGTGGTEAGETDTVGVGTEADGTDSSGTVIGGSDTGESDTVGTETGGDDTGASDSTSDTGVTDPVETDTDVEIDDSDTVSGDTGGALLQEAEAGTLFGSFVVANDVQASGGQFVHVPSGGDVVGDSSSDFVEFSVLIETAGSYQVDAIIRGPDGRQNSFFVQIDEGPVHQWNTRSNNQFTADVISSRETGRNEDLTVNLSVGVHTLRIFVREEGTQLDLIEFELLEASESVDNDAGGTDTGGTDTGGTDVGGSDPVLQQCSATSNIAPGGSASQSSNFNGNQFPASNAIDGDTGNFTHTATGQSPASWELMLDQSNVITEIVLHNRTRGQSRLRDITVTVLDLAGATVYQSDLLNPENNLDSPAQITIELPDGIVGRAIEVTRTPDPDLSGSNGSGNADEAAVLSLAEVEVIGCLVQ